MNYRRFCIAGLAALVGVAALLALQAGGQVPPVVSKSPPTIVEVGPDNVLIERTLDGRVLRTTQQDANANAQNPGRPNVEHEHQEIVIQRPDGSEDRRTVTFPVNPNYGPPGYGRRYLAGDTPQDAESQKLLNQERGAAQEARALASNAQLGNSEAEKADAKKKLREKLVEIFDLQQQRRNREIAKIEERLGKLKETLKKRDAAKDSIVDRRLETLTGGVDELGWEDSLANPANLYAQPPGVTPYPAPVPVPQIEPGLDRPGDGLPGRGGGSVFPVPELPPSLDPTPPAPARAPAPPGAPALPAAPAPPAPAALPALGR